MNTPDLLSPLRFGVFELDARTGELRKQGLKVRLGRQAAKLLMFLLEAPGKIRTREELRQRLWPEPKFIDFDNSLAKAVHVLRETLGDVAGNPRFIETVPGQGYRFIPEPSRPPSKSRASQEIKSIAVLPFATDGSEPDLKFIGRQITCRVTNALAKIPALRVLAHGTVKQQKPQHADPKLIGEELRVDAVLVGELFRHNTGLFLNGELIGSADGRQLWGTHLNQNCESLIESAELFVREVLQQLQPILTPKRNRVGPASSKTRPMPVQRVSGNRN
jgi:DNA-binding winged helix-turn-helix (wHTH) protein